MDGGGSVDDHVDELIPAHVLGALTPRSPRGCSPRGRVLGCMAQLRDAEPATSLLALSAPQVAPPPELRDRLMARWSPSREPEPAPAPPSRATSDAHGLVAAVCADRRAGARGRRDRAGGLERVAAKLADQHPGHVYGSRPARPAARRHRLYRRRRAGDTRGQRVGGAERQDLPGLGDPTRRQANLGGYLLRRPHQCRARGRGPSRRHGGGHGRAGGRLASAHDPPDRRIDAWGLHLSAGQEVQGGDDHGTAGGDAGEMRHVRQLDRRQGDGGAASRFRSRARASRSRSTAPSRWALGPSSSSSWNGPCPS